MNGNNIGEGDAQPGRRLYELYYAEASSKPSLQELLEAFEGLDSDGTGTLNPEEICQAFERLGVVLTAKDLEVIVNGFDSSADGSIDFQEFASAFYDVINSVSSSTQLKEEYAPASSPSPAQPAYPEDDKDGVSKQEAGTYPPQATGEQTEPYDVSSASYENEPTGDVKSESSEYPKPSLPEAYGTAVEPSSTRKPDYPPEGEVHGEEDNVKEHKEPGPPVEPGKPSGDEPALYKERPSKVETPEYPPSNPGTSREEKPEVPIESASSHSSSSKDVSNDEHQEVDEDSSVSKKKDSAEIDYPQVEAKDDEYDRPQNNEGSKQYSEYGRKVVPEGIAEPETKPKDQPCMKHLNQRQIAYRIKCLGHHNGEVATPAKLAQIRITQGIEHSLLGIFIALEAILALITLALLLSSGASCLSYTLMLAGCVGLVVVSFLGMFGHARVAYDVQNDDDGLETPGQHILEAYVHLSWGIESILLIPASFSILGTGGTQCVENADTSLLVWAGVLAVGVAVVSIGSIFFSVRMVTWYEMSQSLGEVLSLWVTSGALLLSIVAGVSQSRSDLVLPLQAAGVSRGWMTTLIIVGVGTAGISLGGFHAIWREHRRALGTFIAGLCVALGCYIVCFVYAVTAGRISAGENCGEVIRFVGVSFFVEYFACEKYVTNLPVYPNATSMYVNPQCATSLGLPKEATALVWEEQGCSIGCINEECCAEFDRSMELLDAVVVGGGTWFLLTILVSILNAIYLWKSSRSNIVEPLLKHQYSRRLSKASMGIFIAGLVITIVVIFGASPQFLPREERIDQCNFDPTLPPNPGGVHSCENGILDGDETGIDCGGGCPAACVTLNITATPAPTFAERTGAPVPATASPTSSTPAVATPSLSLVGSAYVQVLQGAAFEDVGAQCVLPDNVTNTSYTSFGGVLTHIPGIYTIQYSCCSPTSNTVCATPLVRTIEVLATGAPSEAPTTRPSQSPSASPSRNPTTTTASPTPSTSSPSKSPSASPTVTQPTSMPTPLLNGGIQIVLRWDTTNCSFTQTNITSTSAPTASTGIVAGRILELVGEPKEPTVQEKGVLLELNDGCSAPSDLDLHVSFASDDQGNMCWLSGLEEFRSCGNASHFGDEKVTSGQIEASETIMLESVLASYYVVYVDNYNEDRPIENSQAYIEVFADGFYQRLELPSVQQESYDMLGLFSPSDTIPEFESLLSDQVRSRTETTGYRFARFVCIDARDLNYGPRVEACPQYFHRALEGRAFSCATTGDCPACSDPTSSVEYFRDNDADGYGSGSAAFTSCQPASAAFVTQDGDCNDFNTNIGPGVAEVCSNGIDDDCDGEIDNCVTVTPAPTGSSGMWLLDLKQNDSNTAANCHEVCATHGKQCSAGEMQRLVGGSQGETLVNCQNALAKALQQQCADKDDDYVYGSAYEALAGGIFQYAGASGYAHCACGLGVARQDSVAGNVTLTLRGSNPDIVDVLGNGSTSPFTYADPGAECYDVGGFNLTDRVLVTGEAVNLAVVGTYVHVYRCCNDLGECSSKERRIVVESMNDCSNMSTAMSDVPIAYDSTLHGGCVFYRDFHVTMTNSFTVVPPPPGRMYFLGGESSVNRPVDPNVDYTDDMGNVTAQGDCGERPENPDDRRVCFCV